MKRLGRSEHSDSVALIREDRNALRHHFNPGRHTGIVLHSFLVLVRCQREIGELPNDPELHRVSAANLARVNKFGGWAGDAFKQCNEGAHKEYAGDLKTLIDDTEKLAERIQAL